MRSNSPEAIRKRLARQKIREAKERDRLDAEARAQEAAPPTVVPEEQIPQPAPDPAPEQTTAQLGAAEQFELGLDVDTSVPPPPGIRVPRTESTARASSSSSSKSSADTEWHRKWKAKLVGGGMGREAGCEWGADKCVALLSRLDAITMASGKQPMVTAESLRPALVLTMDQLMPASLNNALEKPITHVVLGVLMMAGEAAGSVARIKAAAKEGKPLVPAAPAATPPPPPPAPVPAPASAPAAAVVASSAQTPESPSSPPPTVMPTVASF